MRDLSGDVVVASGNAGKIAEFQRLLGSLPITLRLQGDLGVEPAEETGITFVENALLKARAAARQTGLPALADDSGLAVGALGGAPGVRSARFAEDAGSFTGDDRDAANRRQLLAALEATPSDQRQAFFYCTLVFLRSADDPTPLIAEGRWHGEILAAEQGAGGFGYDALFFDPRQGLSAAELEPGVKNAVSHRGQATRALLAALTST